MIQFEPTITFGAILQTVVIFSGLLVWANKLTGDIRVLKLDIKNLQESSKSFGDAFQQLGKVLTNIAVQDTRISSIDKRIDELAHGKGFVHD